MSYSIRYTTEAANDLRELITFEVQNTGESKGVDHLRLMLENLADNPNIGTKYEEHSVVSVKSIFLMEDLATLHFTRCMML